METETDQGEKMRRVSVIGAGTIGASWAAYFLARGFEVAGYDPAPNGEAFARQFIDTAWPTLEKLEVVQASADRKRFEFFKDPAAAVKGAEFIQESGPEREDLKIELFATLDTALTPDIVIATSSSGLLISRVSAKCRYPERCVIGHPFNPPNLIPLVEVVGGGCHRQGDAILSRHRKVPDPHQEGSEGARRQSPPGGAVARSCPSRRRRRCFRQRCRRGDRLWSRPALGADGTAPDVPYGRRRRRHEAFHESSRRPDPGLDG